MYQRHPIQKDGLNQRNRYRNLGNWNKARCGGKPSGIKELETRWKSWKHIVGGRT